MNNDDSSLSHSYECIESIHEFISSSRRILLIPSSVCTSSLDVQTLLHEYGEWYTTHFHPQQEFRCMYLHPKRVTVDRVRCSPYIQYHSLHHYCQSLKCLETRRSTIVVLEDFDVECLDKYLFIISFLKRCDEFQKLIIVSSLLDFEHQMTAIQSYGGCAHRLDVAILQPMKAVWEPSTTTEVVEYRSVLHDHDGHLQWEFDGATFITPPDMCDVVKTILMDDVPNTSERTIVFVQSADVCEYVRDAIREFSSLKTITIHGQKSHQEVDDLLRSEFDVVVSTNILESKDRTVPNVRTVIDFGLCYAINSYGFLSLRYCSRTEMMQRSSKAPSRRVFRVMTEDFYKSLPYMEVATFDWKHRIMHLILNDQIVPFLKTLHGGCCGHPLVDNHVSPMEKDVYRDVLDLVTCRLIHHDFVLTKHATMYRHVLHRLLRTPFHTKNYSVITHFHHMLSTECVPLVTQVLTSMTLALIDTVYRYGQYKMFYVPLRHGRSPNQTFGAWMRVVYAMSGLQEPTRNYFIFHDYHFLSMIVQLILTVVMSSNTHASVKFFHLNSRVFRQFVYRWKVLCSRDVFNVFGYHAPITDHAFFQYIKTSLSPFVERRQWNLRPREYPSYLFPSIHRKGTNTKPQHIHGEWVSFPNVITEAFHERMWRLMDYSCWSHRIRPYDRRLFFDDDMERPHMTIDVEHGLHLPLPQYVETHVSNLDRSIDNAVSAYRSRQEERSCNRSRFNDCIKAINDEVAFRPGMVKYLECEQRFYQCMESFVSTREADT